MNAIKTNVQHALAEDIGTGDITAALIPENRCATARIICRDRAVICGRPWFDEVFRQLDSTVEVEWLVEEGAVVEPNQTLVVLKGPARSFAHRRAMCHQLPANRFGHGNPL